MIEIQIQRTRTHAKATVENRKSTARGRGEEEGGKGQSQRDSEPSIERVATPARPCLLHSRDEIEVVSDASHAVRLDAERCPSPGGDAQGITAQVHSPQSSA